MRKRCRSADIVDLLRRRTGSFETELVSTGIGTHGSPLGDLDGDGDLDILGVPFNWDVPRVDLWLQNGTDTSARPRLIRGDADADGSVQVNDAIVMLRVLFLFDPIPSCLEALDVNESGAVDLSDPIATLILLFRPDMEPLRPLVGECEPLREGALSCDGFAPCDEPPLAVR
ncbi:MAG TPA: hypothetical protein VK116_18285 [Planctomycetota bacterium]|nr:hypothetical protein [Planctomycetota bacterium]